jgi:phage shock protein E
MRLLVTIFTLATLLPLQGHASNSGAGAAAGKPILVDVRSEEEYQAGHVDGAINIPHEEIGDRITSLQLASDQPIFLYCRSGRRSGIALATLSDLGYTSLTNIGGLEEARAWFERSAGQ